MNTTRPLPTTRPSGTTRAAAPFGVYVHVPFCSRRCDYCAFATWTDRHHLWDRYMAAVRMEAARLGRWGRGPATSVFFGGGTPSLVAAEMLTDVLGAVAGSIGLAPGAEVTVECNPDTVDNDKLSAYRAGGVTRLSFGVQSMVPHVLASLGREHQPANVHRAVEAAAQAGFAGRYSVDLIFGAAGETKADWQATLDRALALEPAPAHISAYALTVEPATPLASQPHRHPLEDDQADKYVMADVAFAQAGLEWYEISNWARPGSECRHNQLYWAQGEYVGLGCAAHSHLAEADGTARRWWNVRTPERYCSMIESGGPAQSAEEVLTAEQRAFEALVLDLRTSKGVDAELVPDELYELGLISLSAGERGQGRALLTVPGRLLANEVAARLRMPAPAGAQATGPS